MREELTKDDIKELKNSCKPGVIVPLLFFIIGSSLIMFFEYFNLPYVELPYNITIWQLIIASLFLYLGICFMISYALIRKYVLDIKNGEKEIVIKTIMMKENRTDYEAGSGAVGHLGTEMASYKNYAIIVDNTRYNIDEDFYNSVNNGDEVCFHYAPKSGDLLRIDLKKMTVFNSTPINLFN